jgi:hypothetical protein
MASSYWSNCFTNFAQFSFVRWQRPACNFAKENYADLVNLSANRKQEIELTVLEAFHKFKSFYSGCKKYNPCEKYKYSLLSIIRNQANRRESNSYSPNVCINSLIKK